MKIVRTRDESGAIVHVAETEPNWGCLLVGSIYSDPQLSEVTIPIRDRLAPINPPLVIGIAQNYRDHNKEMKSEENTYPAFFIKMPRAVVGANEAIRIPTKSKTTKVDFEAELAVILKENCCNVPKEEALDKVLGYTAANDVSARDWQKEWGGGQFCRGKGFDTFCPLGPAIVTADEISEPQSLEIVGKLNGEVMQRGNTSDMIFPVEELIAFLSTETTLPAGTVILTGTPAGVGHARNPPLYLKPGDTYEVNIAGIGTLSSKVAEQDA